ncbi:GNAT family N-acetyltransferase [Clostridium algoriphilum]|uniref:GNAT family N-acetyltransferase n=1 Tax=Clostridium algoriphilum TaxID=198347 RepID=UPI001CF3FB75|nr:GNAT family N-acetyltransferase [Clostridium algoriphilum]MCB2292511.1 GNAT family N-acetyltransferase [Clostridium algoriphilum]
MFNIDISFEDISIRNVEEQDVLNIKNWIDNQQISDIEAGLNYGITEFHERYLEYFVSEGEYFLKVLCGSEIIGIIKGRIEFKNPNEVWIMCYLVEIKLYDDEISKTIINEFLKHLYDNYGISNFYTFVSANNQDMLRLWKSNDFEIIRVTSSFLEIDNEDKDILILEKIIQ